MGTMDVNFSFEIFDKIYVVNLQSDLKRKDHIIKEFRRIDLSRFVFVKAEEASSHKVLDYILTSKVVKYPPCFRCGQDYCECHNNVIIRPQVANWLSFLGVFEDAVRNQHQFCLVCEDDVAFSDKSEDIMSRLLTMERLHDEEINMKKPLLIRLGYPGFDSNIHESTETPRYSKNYQMSNSCFSFNYHYALLILNSFNKINHTSDVYFHCHIINSYVQHFTMVPPPCYDLSQSKRIISNIHPKGIDSNDKVREWKHVKRVTNKIGFSYVFNGNFGDLLGPYIFKKITGIEPVGVHVNDLTVRDSINFDHYLTVGSILKHVTPNSIIWGIGVMNRGDFKLIKDKINKTNVFGVRGYETINELNKIGGTELNNISVGDPAILLPLLYRPKANRKKYKLGLIPHCSEFKEVNSAVNWHDVMLIKLDDLRNYKNIEKIIDQIVSCDKIISSSLHGIIVAHSYAVPAAWHNFTHITEQELQGTTHLKFKDYFSSVELSYFSPLRGLSSINMIPENQYTLPTSGKLQSIQEDLLSSCPFNIYSFSIEETKYIHNRRYKSLFQINRNIFYEKFHDLCKKIT